MDDITHIVDILVALGCKDLTKSTLESDLGMIMDPRITIDSIVDVLLDISMFNSYSFLKSLSPYEKRQFNIKKVDYIKKHLLFDYYDLDNANHFYLSFAFAARSNSGNFDIIKYASIWDDFIKFAYPYSIHVEKTIAEQLKQHVDFGHMPKNTEKMFQDKPNGCYLLLRKNKVRSKKLVDDIDRLFKRRKSIIISVHEFPLYERFFKNLDVSVYKIVK